MDNNQIRSIVSWIKSHPQNAEEFKDDNPSTIFLKFITDPELIWEYEDFQCDMLGKRVESGCNYVCLRGPLKNMLCNQVLVEGQSKCKFHNADIFSDQTRNYIRKYHITLNNICSGL